MPHLFTICIGARHLTYLIKKLPLSLLFIIFFFGEGRRAEGVGFLRMCVTYFWFRHSLTLARNKSSADMTTVVCSFPLLQASQSSDSKIAFLYMHACSFHANRCALVRATGNGLVRRNLQTECKEKERQMRPFYTSLSIGLFWFHLSRECVLSIGCININYTQYSK